MTRSDMKCSLCSAGVQLWPFRSAAVGSINLHYDYAVEQHEGSSSDGRADISLGGVRDYVEKPTRNVNVSVPNISDR